MGRRKINPTLSDGTFDYNRGKTPITTFLAERQQQLEAIVADFVTTRKTEQPVRFKDRRRYLKADWKEQRAAVEALQLLYRLQEARAAGDVDAITLEAMSFDQANNQARMQEYHGKNALQIMIEWKQNEIKEAYRGQQTAKLKTDQDWALFSKVREKHRGKYNQYSAIARKMTKEGIEMSPRTARRRSDELAQMDNANVVTK